MDPKNAVAVRCRLQGVVLRIETEEPLLGVGNGQAAIHSAFQSTEDVGSGGRLFETDVEVAGEGAPFAGGLNHVLVTIDFCLAFVHVVKLDFLEDTASQEEAG